MGRWFTVFYLLLMTFCCQHAMAAIPEGTIVVQAEAMSLEGSGWQVADHNAKDWYTGHPLGQMLSGSRQGAGTAKAGITLPGGGRYRLWLRHLDMLSHRSKAGFAVTVNQDTGKIASADIGASERSIRATPDGGRKWGAEYARWIWEFVEFEAEAGEATILISKLHEVAVSSCTRTIDIMLITPDLEYEPRITDVTPFFVKIRMLPSHKTPVTIQMWGRRAYTPWYTDHGNINIEGIHRGLDAGTHDKAKYLSAGQESPWVDIAPYLAYGGLNQISLYAKRSYGSVEQEAGFEVLFSRTPSESGLLRVERRTGEGDGYQFAVDLSDYTLVTEHSGSRASLAMAKATPNVPGKAPSAFPFFTGMQLKSGRSTAEAIANETEALRIIGVKSSNSFWPSCFFFHHTAKPGCLSRPDRDGINKLLADMAVKRKDYANWTAINLMDEPSFHYAHVAECKECQQGFGAFLEKLNLPEAEIKELHLTNTPDGANEQEKISYYYTRRYMNHLMTEMLRAGSSSSETNMPGVPTTVNFACELMDGNLVSGSVDWFEILGSGALTYGWNEDWGGWSRTRQVNGFYVDTLRAACRIKGVPYGIYNILCRTPRDIQARAYMEFGHGVRAMHFFNYGPYYAISSDTNSERPEVYEAIKRVTYAMGAVEDDVLSAAPARGDAAQLLCVSSDIWHVTRDNIYGKERLWLNLLLRHCSVSCDVLHEDDLSQHLAAYPVLFATDANLNRASLKPLVEWVKGGGVLYLGAGALMRDEFDAPLGLDRALGITERQQLEIKENPGRADYEMTNLKPLGHYQKIPLLCAMQEPFERFSVVGQGKVVQIGFFPGISYIATSKRAHGAEHFDLIFDAEHRDWMQGVLADIGLSPRIRVVPYNVEANLLEGEKADILAISNWGGGDNMVQIEVEQAATYKSITSVTARNLAYTVRGGKLTLSMLVGPGDLIRMER